MLPFILHNYIISPELRELLKHKSSDLEGFLSDRKDLGLIRDAQRDRIRVGVECMMSFKSSIHTYGMQSVKRMIVYSGLLLL